VARHGRRAIGGRLSDPAHRRSHGTLEEQAQPHEVHPAPALEAAPEEAEGREEVGDRQEVARPAARELRSRRSAAAALAAVEALGAGRPLRLALAGAFLEFPRLGPKERRYAAVAARGVARWLRVCDAALVRARAPRAIPADRALLRYLAWRVAVEGDAPEAAAAALRLPGPRRPRAVTDAALLEVARALPRPGPEGPLARDAGGRPLAPPSDPVVALALRHSVPDAIAGRLLRDVGPVAASACLAALNREPEIALRVNAARTTRAEVVAALRVAGVDAAPGSGPWAVRVADRAGLFDAPAFRAGLVEVQDESSQAAVELCRPRPGERWLDLCAGSGGKALALAGLGASVAAWDASARRLAELPRRARRAGLRVQVLREEPSGTWDGVLVDAPCTGSGALAREPDARWRVDEAGVARLAREQSALLERAAALVRPGGTVVFATCSLFREEGEEVVARFLRDRPGFRQEKAWRRWPHLHPGAGFFAARLRRKRP
jgi:16S rRNA (cytosine967-C5)-methyltransferase